MTETQIESPDYGGQVIVLSILNDAALDELRRDVAIEQERRYILASAEQQAAELNERYTAAIGRADGEAWVQPTGGHDVYKTGDSVTFEGQVWESVIDGNVWSPAANAAGWKLIG